MRKRTVTILGAGPTGLSAALALTKAGHAVRILERNPSGTTESRAVGVNRRSLLHLETVGAAAPILAAGEPLRRARFIANGKQIGQLKIPQAETGPPTMVALPQDVTEHILGARLEEVGVPIEWSAEARDVRQTTDCASVLAHGPNGEETIESDFVLGADGARSLTRKSLGCSFDGNAYDGEWSLLDARVEWPWPGVQAVGRFDDPASVLFMVTLGNGRYRFIGNTRNLEPRISAVMPIGEIFWQNDFTLSERRVDRFGEGRVWLAGDAAHVHSPVGGMGMNLGIDDAFDFARTVTTEDFAAYNTRRLAEATTVMVRADRGFRLITSTSPLVKMMRNTLIRCLTSSAFLQRRLAKAIAASDR